MAYILFFILIAVAAIFLVYASCSIRAGIYMKSICYLRHAVESGKKSVMLTFDDAPDPIQTSKVLSVLKKHEIKALFFLIGKNAEEYESVAKEIIKDGHTIGSHSYSHNPYYPLWGYQRIKEELARGNSMIETLVQKPVSLFRPPFGITNPPIAKAVKELNLTSIGWSIRSFDTNHNLMLEKEREKVVKRIVKQLEPGAIILLHDRLEGSELLLEELVVAIRKNGYEIENALIN